MSWLSKLFGSGIAEPVDAVGNALDKLFTSDDERNAATIVMEKLRQQPGTLQAEINKLEAQHRSLLVAGWRPAIGWVCAASLFCYYVPQFVVATIVWVIAIQTSGWTAIPSYPVSDSSLMELVFTMLGMGVLRTGEKLAGKSK